jgi:hypothetical protein
MDDALEPHRQFAQRRGRAERERAEEIAGEFHRRIPSPVGKGLTEAERFA